MRILLVTNLYPCIANGELAPRVVRRLRQQGHEVHVLASTAGEGECEAEEKVTRSLRLTSELPPELERLDVLQQTAEYNRARTQETLATWRPDVMLCWSLNRLSLGPVHAAREQGVPVVCSMADGHWREYRPSASSDREAAHFPLATWRELEPLPTLVVSESLRHQLIDEGLPMGRTEVLPLGVELAELPCEPTPHATTEPLRILYVGPVRESRGVSTLLRACQELHRLGVAWTLDLVGTGTGRYEAELEEWTEQEGLSEQVMFMGALPADWILKQYHTHHVLVCPSEWAEPTSQTIVQGMATGCAVISTAIGGHAELLKDGQNGLVCRTASPRHLGLCLQRLATDESKRRELIEQARDYVERQHDLDVFVGRLEAFLQQEVGS
jgi:glycosyltransferase involved in cell wall biosynthesis